MTNVKSTMRLREMASRGTAERTYHVYLVYKKKMQERLIII